MSIFLAHGSIEGIGDLWNGLLHPLRSPSHILVLVALGLLAGQRQRIKAPIISFLICSGVTILLMLLFPHPTPSPWINHAISATVGILLASAAAVSGFAQTILFGLAGFSLAADSAPDESGFWVSFKILIGVWTGLAILVLNFANYSAMCPQKRWSVIAFRVLGSWIAAVSVLALALTLRN